MGYKTALMLCWYTGKLQFKKVNLAFKSNNENQAQDSKIMYSIQRIMLKKQVQNGKEHELGDH